jgi:hypothetical protein
MQKYHVTLLQHTEVLWLSRGKILTRAFELRVEVLLFLKDNNEASFSEFPEDTKWLLKVAYLADVYQHLKHLEHQHTGPNR